MRNRNPRTDGEWQEAVDGAEFLLLMDSLKQYGLIEGGPTVNTDRCDEILRKGKARGFRPASHDVLVARYLTV